MRSCSRAGNDPRPAPPFEVGMSDELREHIRALSRRAAAMGIGTAFRDSVRRILEALRQDPRRAGDPIRNLRGLKMTEYQLSQCGGFSPPPATRSPRRRITGTSRASLPHLPRVGYGHRAVPLLP